MPTAGSVSTTWSVDPLPWASATPTQIAVAGLQPQLRRNHSNGYHRLLRETPSDDSATDKPARERPIRCRSCSAVVTYQQFRTEIAGSHTHQVTNPQGVEFVISCFSTADGCLPVGQPYRRHSWFRGYQWQVAHCRQCGAQLGWFFSDGPTNPLYALIINRLQH